MMHHIPSRCHHCMSVKAYPIMLWLEWCARKLLIVPLLYISILRNLWKGTLADSRVSFSMVQRKLSMKLTVVHGLSNVSCLHRKPIR